jgi:alkylhydroperoxidase/carboxymuconolactone decarboxylase family protein YurZ
MKTRKGPAATTASPDVKVPGTAALIAGDHPDLWDAYQRFGEQVTAAGPLDARTQRLVHLAFAIATGSEGATHSHVRRALDAGLGAAELEHVALLAATTVGWPQAVKGYTWVHDVTGRRSE